MCPADAVRKWLRAWDSRDAGDCVDLYSADVCYSDPTVPSGIQGAAPLRGYLERLFSLYPRTRVSVVETLMGREPGCVFVFWRRTVPDQLAGALVACVDGITRLLLHQGSIQRESTFYDRFPIARNHIALLSECLGRTEHGGSYSGYVPPSSLDDGAINPRVGTFPALQGTCRDQAESRHVLDQLLACWNGNDVEGAMDLYADDVCFRDSARPEWIVGKHEVRKHLAWVHEASPQMSYEVIGIDETQTRGGFVLTWRGRVPDGLAGEYHVIELEGMQYLRFHNGLIVRSECYYDQMPLLPEILLSSRVAHT